VKPQTLFRYQYSNHLGSACLELDDQAGIISYEEFHPYGTTAHRVVATGIEAAPKRYRYTGMERDEESGLTYHSVRYYVPWLGTWTGPDPSGITYGVNVYAHSGANPLRFADVNGRSLTDTVVSFLDRVEESLGLAEPTGPQTTPISRESPKLREYVAAEQSDTSANQTTAEKKAKGIGRALSGFKGSYERYREEQERKAKVQVQGTVLVAGSLVVAVAPEAAPLLVEFAGVSAPVAATSVAVAGTAGGAAQEYGLTGKVTPSGLIVSAGFSTFGAAKSLQSLEELQGISKVERGVISGVEREKTAVKAAAGNVGAKGEIDVAELLSSEGVNVHFQTPTPPKGPPKFGTADYLVGGEPGTGVGGTATDVLTPITSEPDSVISSIVKKENQAPNIIVNMSATAVTEWELGDVMSRVRTGFGANNIKSVRFVKVK
jgi:RHS repeat-associated protein